MKLLGVLSLCDIIHTAEVLVGNQLFSFARITPTLIRHTKILINTKIFFLLNKQNAIRY